MSRLLTLLAQTSGAPFPSGPIDPTSGNTVTNYGGMSGPDAVKAAANAGAAAASGSDHLWTEWVSPQSPIYDAIIRATIPLVLLGFVLWATAWARDVLHEYENPIHWQKVVWPLTVILLFYGNGKLLADCTTLGKVVTYNVANGILNRTGSNVVIKQQIQTRQLNTAYYRYFAQESSRCNNIPSQTQKNQCLQEASDLALNLAKQATGNQTGLPSNPWFAFLKVAATGAIEGLLWASAGGFHYLSGILLAVWGSTGPLWVSLTLLPINTKGINFFVSGFIGFAVLIIVFDLLTAAVAVSLAQAADADPLFVPLLMGFLNPIFAFMIASGTGVGMFVGISSFVRWLIGR